MKIFSVAVEAAHQEVDLAHQVVAAAVLDPVPQADLQVPVQVDPLVPEVHQLAGGRQDLKGMYRL